MKRVALRFFEKFPPEDGTIAEHQDEIRLLLIHSSKTDRYWAYVDKIIKETPSFDEFLSY